MCQLIESDLETPNPKSRAIRSPKHRDFKPGPRRRAHGWSAGDRNVIRYTFSGTHDGELMGFPPTGKYVSISGISIARIAGGKVAEEWPMWDQLGVMQQIGTIE